MNIIKTGNDLYQHKAGVIDSLLNARTGFLDAGKHMMIIKTKKLYKLEGDYTFAYWVENELGISKSTAYQLIDVYEKFGDVLSNPDFKELDYAKIALLAPLVGEGATVDEKEEMLYMANGQSVRGLKENIKEMKGQLQEPCDHELTEPWLKCVKCGKFFKE